MITPRFTDEQPYEHLRIIPGGPELSDRPAISDGVLYSDSTPAIHTHLTSACHGDGCQSPIRPTAQLPLLTSTHHRLLPQLLDLRLLAIRLTLAQPIRKRLRLV